MEKKQKEDIMSLLRIRHELFIWLNLIKIRIAN
jgi:hypothetical protein